MCQPVQLMFLELVEVDGGLGAVEELGFGGALVPGAPAVLVGWPPVGSAVVPGADVAGAWAELPVGPLEPGLLCCWAPGLPPRIEDWLLSVDGIGPPAATSWPTGREPEESEGWL